MIYANKISMKDNFVLSRIDEVSVLTVHTDIARWRKRVCIADAFERNYQNINMFKQSDVNATTQRNYTASVKYSLTCLIATPSLRRRDKGSLPSSAPTS